MAARNMKTREKTVFVAQQLHFANTLAGNDPKLRERAMKKLRKYLLARAHGSFCFTHDDFMRIWKGLFYCMWMSDKPLVQEELAEQISHLVHCFNRVDMTLTFINAFFDTLLIEWYGIDYHRLDKFQMFVRRFLRQTLVFCRNKKWSNTAVIGLCKVFEKTVLSPCKNADDCSDIGLIMHFVDIFVEELAKVSAGKLPKDTTLEFLKPFTANLAEQSDFRLQTMIHEKIFLTLIRQSPEGMEYEEKFEAWKRAGFPGTSWKDMVFVGKNDNRSGDKIRQLDPRAGKVNVYLPHLEFDARSVARMLQEYAAKSSMPPCKKLILKISRKFLDLARRKYPLATNLSKVLIDSKKHRFSKDVFDEAVEDLLDFEKQVKQKSQNLENKDRGEKRKKNASKLKESKKMKMEIIKNGIQSENQENSKVNSSIKLSERSRKKKKIQIHSSWSVSELPKIANQESDVCKQSSKSLAPNNDVDNEILNENIIDDTVVSVNEMDQVDLEVEPATFCETSVQEEIEKNPRSLDNCSSDKEIGDDGKEEVESSSELKTNLDDVKDDDSNSKRSNNDCKKTIEDNGEVLNSQELNDSISVVNNDNNVSPDKEKGSFSKGEAEDNTIKEVEASPLRRSARRKSIVSYVFSKSAGQKRGNGDCTQEKESINKTPVLRGKMKRALCLDTSNNLNGENLPVSSPAKKILQTTGGKTPSNSRISLHATPSSSSKKVNIALRMNSSQDISDYIMAVRQSPSITHDANKKPHKGVLKRSSIGTPINPFYVPPK